MQSETRMNTLGQCMRLQSIPQRQIPFLISLSMATDDRNGVCIGTCYLSTRVHALSILFHLSQMVCQCNLLACLRVRLPKSTPFRRTSCSITLARPSGFSRKSNGRRGLNLTPRRWRARWCLPDDGDKDLLAHLRP